MFRPFKRMVVVVLDSLGVGALPDAEAYDDAGANTLLHTAEAVGGLDCPNLQAMGLGNIQPCEGIAPVESPAAHYARAVERSLGKDTTSGHWELMGLEVRSPFPLYPDGFPEALIRAFVERAGRAVIGNRPASGTEIIKELGEEHLKTGALIVYTSADSVFQIAAHEEAVPLAELYRVCRIARELLTGEHAVGRVIARPFIGKPGAFVRTPNRRDYSLLPPSPTVLDRLKEAKKTVFAVGKIEDIFAKQGITEAVHTTSNSSGVEETIAALHKVKEGLVFTNLVDFDMLYGHRRDANGYARALEEFDRRLPEICSALRKDDLLILTADHGCDPTHRHTDHTREYIPILVHHPGCRGMDLGTRGSYADVGQTIAMNFELEPCPVGESFLHQVAGT